MLKPDRPDDPPPTPFAGRRKRARAQWDQALRAPLTLGGEGRKALGGEGRGALGGAGRGALGGEGHGALGAGRRSRGSWGRGRRTWRCRTS